MTVAAVPLTQKEQVSEAGTRALLICLIAVLPRARRKRLKTGLGEKKNILKCKETSGNPHKARLFASKPQNFCAVRSS